MKNEICEPQSINLFVAPLSDEKAFITCIKLVYKPGDTIWLKLNHNQFFIGKRGEENLFLTFYLTKGRGNTRKLVKSITDIYSHLRERSASGSRFASTPFGKCFASAPPRECFASTPFGKCFASTPPRECFASTPFGKCFASTPPRECFASAPPRECFASAPPRECFASTPFGKCFASAPPRECFASAQSLDGGVVYIPGKPSQQPLKEYCLMSNDIGAGMDWGTYGQQWEQINQFVAYSELYPALVVRTYANCRLNPHKWGQPQQHCCLLWCGSVNPVVNSGRKSVHPQMLGDIDFKGGVK